MVLVVIILLFTSISTLQSWDIPESDHFDLMESWGVARMKREEKIKTKFSEHPQLSCDLMHKTEETPFAAIVLFRASGRLLCMGSIVDDQHILTAKRCYEKADVSDLLVLVGYYKAFWGRYAQVRNVKKILRHEYEVAILRLTEKLKFTDYIQAVRLPSTITKSEKDIEKAFPPPLKVVGFFVDRYDVPGDFIDKEKTYKIKEDTYTPFEECKKNYTKIVLETSKLFCVIGNASYCWGGWGSPILKWITNSYYLQIGVVIADNCTSETTAPFLAARTDVYGDWIRGNSFHGHQPR